MCCDAVRVLQMFCALFSPTRHRYRCLYNIEVKVLSHSEVVTKQDSMTAGTHTFTFIIDVTELMLCFKVWPFTATHFSLYTCDEAKYLKSTVWLHKASVCVCVCVHNSSAVINVIGEKQRNQCCWWGYSPRCVVCLAPRSSSRLFFPILQRSSAAATSVCVCVLEWQSQPALGKHKLITHSLACLLLVGLTCWVDDGTLWSN